MAEERGGERWLKKSGYGLMFHYEAFRKHSAQSYNEAVDSFDVNRFVNAVADTSAGHVIFVIGQHWGRYCAPNSAYEKLLGVGNGVWTSKRRSHPGNRGGACGAGCPPYHLHDSTRTHAAL